MNCMMGTFKLDSGYQVSVFAVSPQWFQDLADPKKNGHTLGFSELILSIKLHFHNYAAYMAC